MGRASTLQSLSKGLFYSAVYSLSIKAIIRHNHHHHLLCALKSFSVIYTVSMLLLQTSAPPCRINPKEFPQSEWLFPETTKNFDRLPLQYRGYCGYSLVRFDRLLLPANPSIGVLRHKNNYYAFANRESAKEFHLNLDL